MVEKKQLLATLKPFQTANGNHIFINEFTTEELESLIGYLSSEGSSYLQEEGVFHKVCKACGSAFCTINKDDEYCLKCQETRPMMDSPADDLHTHKKDKGKAPWHLLPMKQVGHIVDILDFGRKKYSENSWQKLGPDEYGNPAIIRYMDALYRHMNAWKEGEKIDPESGFSHLWHVACNIVFMMYFEDKENAETAL